MPWTCLCGANHNAMLAMGDVCDSCGNKVVGAECVDYVIGYSVVTETEPLSMTPIDHLSNSPIDTRSRDK
jgi:hypothetical protein